MAQQREPSVPPGDGDEPTLDPRKYALRFHTTLPSTRPAINRAVRKVLQVADELGGFAQSKADLEIALREALANAIIHGNRNHRKKRVLLRCYGEPEVGVLIVVRDEGSGFDPRDVPDPRSAERIFLHHGRGIFLMRELMDRVEHRDGGREVLLFKSCDADREPGGDAE